MDNFSAHTAALTVVRSDEQLSHINVLWLPPNSTAKLQPLDQGIIYNFKANYRKHWLRFVMDKTEAQKPPLLTINVLKAILWSIQLWDEVRAESIHYC